jgi:hypothetical protein
MNEFLQDKYKAAYEEKYATAEDRPAFDGLLWKDILEARSMCMYPHKQALGGLPSNFYVSSSSASNVYSTATSGPMCNPAEGTSTANEDMKEYIDDQLIKLSQNLQAFTEKMFQQYNRPR